jgi:hypothetical protein
MTFQDQINADPVFQDYVPNEQEMLDMALWQIAQELEHIDKTRIHLSAEQGCYIRAIMRTLDSLSGRIEQ